MSIDLGLKPDTLSVSLTRDSDFSSNLESVVTGTETPLDWPAGTILTLKFGTGDEWAATVDDNVASWSVDFLVVNALIDDMTSGALHSARLRYQADGGVDLVWALGRATVYQ